MNIESTAFANNQTIPSKYTCDGNNINPPLSISDIPEEAESLAIVVEDPDAPTGRFVHWTVWNISPASLEIEEDSIPEGAVEGTTDFSEIGYGGPCPPNGEHRYLFKVYALGSELDLSKGADTDMVDNAIQHHVIAEAELIGRYAK